MNETTLRDQFAMAAMASIHKEIVHRGLDVTVQEVADRSYRFADAMMKARVTEGEEKFSDFESVRETSPDFFTSDGLPF